MQVGDFRLTYAYAEGARCYRYDVKPDTASFLAVCTVAEKAMQKAIEEAGVILPVWWTLSSSYDIARAATEAVRNYKP